MTKGFRILVFLLVALVVAPAAQAAPLTTNPDTSPQFFTTGAFGTNVVPEGKSPTTGLDFTGEYRPLVVQLGNAVEARPLWNLSEADVVYEAIYWGPAHTRYTAIYSDNHPTLVGGVRSARWQHCDIRQEWDAPFVFWGGQTEVGSSIADYFRANGVPKQMLFSAVNISNTNRNSSAFGRDSRRVSPGNAIANLEQIAQQEWPTNDDGTPYKPKSHAFSFSTTPTRGQDTAQAIYIPYDEKDFFPHYTYNAQERLYERWYCGQEQFDGQSGKRIVASNVIVQYAALTYVAGNASRPMMTLTGQGVMDAFIDGRHIRGMWTRNTINDRTIFSDMSGNEITLMPGKTFIQIVPLSFVYTYTTADGTEKTLDYGTKVEAEVFTDEGNLEEMDQMAEE